MRQRHRMPTIFSLSMLDVLCCGMGAVIFLMILYSWDARRQTAALVAARERAGLTDEELKETKAILQVAETRAKALTGELEELLAKRDQLLVQLERAAEQERRSAAELDQTRRELVSAQKSLTTKEDEKTTLRTNIAMLEKDLQEKGRQLSTIQLRREEAEKLATMLPLLREEIAAASKRIQDLDKETTQQRRQIVLLEDKLSTTEKSRAQAEATAADLPKARELLAATERRSKDAQMELEQFRKKADDASARLQESQEQTRSAQSNLAATQKALADQKAIMMGDGRFAGVDLNGKRVIFLVDMSGSMSAVDPRTIDTNKSPEVGKTLAQVLRSLQNAEMFQVILFADDTRFLLGSPGEWLTYDRQKSPEEVQQAMAAVKPAGNTNMYAAFEAAFRFKSQGLDTIFLFSDGLPNIGAGLPNPAPIQEGAAAQALGKYVRDTIRGSWNPPNNAGRVKIHAVGFFYESPNLGAFLWALTRENGGNFVGMSKP